MPDAPAGTPDVSAQVQDLVSKIFSGSNWRNEVERTVKRNVKLLAKNKELTAENETLRGGGLKDGEKKLTKEEAVMFDAFKALNLKPEEVKVVLDEHKKLKVKEQEQSEEKQYQMAAEALEFENVPALTRWLKREGLHLEFKEEVGRDDEGKKTLKKVPVVRPKADDKASLETLEAYLEREVPEFIDTFKTLPPDEDGEGDEDESIEGLDEDTIVERASAAARKRVGVRVPATRTAGGSSVAARERKAMAQLSETAAADPIYSV